MYLLLGEWLQPDGDRATPRNASSIRDCRAAGDDDSDRPSLISLAFLEADDLFQVVGLADARRLEELIEAVQQDNRKSAAS